MMDIPTNSSLIGDFSVFGYTRNFDESLKSRFTEKLGILPQKICIGNAGDLFYYTSYGDVAETNEAAVIKLGFLRSLERSPLTSKSILEKHLIGPGFIQSNEMRGNGLIFCLGKTSPKFVAYKSILGVPQLYYYELDGEIICSDRLSCLVKLLDRVELNEDVVPMHFLFRSIPGGLTYYRHINRMLPGQFIRWVDGHIRERSIKSISEIDTSVIKNGNDAASTKIISSALNGVVGDSFIQANASGKSLATLLSGGVDSTLIQYFVNLHDSNNEPHSFSYAVNSEDFQREIQYALKASKLLHTNHTFVPITPGDFPGLLTRTVDILAQPPILETEPCMLSIAEFAAREQIPYRYFFSGQGADTLFGLTYSVKLKGIQTLRNIPGSVSLLKGLGKLFSPFARFSNMLNKGSQILLVEGESDSFISPANSIAVYGDIEILRNCFGDELLKKALKYRRDFAAEYLDTNHYLEKVHLIDLFTDTYELGVQRQQIFLANEKEQLHPFFDDDLLSAAFAFSPGVRYIKGFRPKYLLKDVLSQETHSTISKGPKGFSIFENDLNSWMKSGPLRELIESIEIPAFLSKAEFDRQLKRPDYFLWILLNYDIFFKQCIL